MKFVLPDKNYKILWGMSAVGLLSIVAGFILSADRTWLALLSAGFFVLSITLVGLLFATIQFIAGAKWSVVLRRIPETLIAPLGLAAVLIGVVALGGLFHLNHVYEWFDDAIVAKDEILQQKKTYLNKYFFIVRLIIYFTVWAYMGYAIRKNSNLQDEKKDAAIKLKLTKLSAAYTLIFAYSFLVATIDIVMSLQPHWFTTMFPVYTFANGWFGAIAAIIIILVTVQKNNALKDVSTEHLHDLGKWLLMSVVFWAYIAFSMHMLTWYANMPEETYFLEVRLQGNWKYFTVALWMLHFVIPFLILLSRDIKREGKRIVKVAWYSLFVTFLDIVWIVNGSVLGHEGGHTKVDDLPVSLVDLGLFIGVIGLGGIMFFKAFAKVNEAPTGDIDYETSRHFHQTF